MSRKHRIFTKSFKLKVVHERLKGIPVAQLVRQYDVHANLVYRWTEEYTTHPETAFRTAKDDDQTVSDHRTTAELEQMIGRLTMENDFLKKALAHAERTLQHIPQQQQDGAKS